MAVITPAQSDIRTEETSYRSAVSESLMQKIGANINYLNDTTDTHTSDIASANAAIALINSTISIVNTTVSTNQTVPANQIWFITSFSALDATITRPNGSPEVFTGAAGGGNVILPPTTTITVTGGSFAVTKVTLV